MIPRKTLETAMFEAVRLAAVSIPPDVKEALEKALSEETSPLAKAHLETSLKNFEHAAKGKGLVCGDTGFPVFYVKAGNMAAPEGGWLSLRTAAEAAAARATKDAWLRPTMVDPVTRKNPGDNVGPGLPIVDLEFDAGLGEDIEILAMPKGGGSEIFGTFYRMLFPSDGLAGVKKFVMDSVRDGCYAGKICPPAIIGVGIGGTADLCMKMAKKAAISRPVGRGNPDPAAKELELELLGALRKTGLGPMGSEGVSAVMAVNVETALTHTAALPVAVNAQCLAARRWKAVIHANGKIDYTGEI
jgi:L(+)-tartrate dehydratase alpha subunit